MSVIDDVVKEVDTVMAMVDLEQIHQAETLIQKDKRIFILGAGRSGLMAKGFAMRLMHIGFTVFVIGETITPSIQGDDILVSVSGSGQTQRVLELTKKAKRDGIKVVAVTSKADSPLAQLGNTIIIVPGATKNGYGVQSIQLLSTLFDQSVHITLDVLCLEISRRNHVTNAEAKGVHSNLE